MQVKKFEAPTIQEALEHVKRELGPEAVILQTKRNKKGFGLLSKSSVEITAAVAEGAISKKKSAERVLSDNQKDVLSKMSASKQKAVIHRYGRGDSAPETPAPKNNQAMQVAPANYNSNRVSAVESSVPSRSYEHEDVRQVKDELLRLRDLVTGLQKNRESTTDRSSRFDDPAFGDAFDYLVLNGMNRRSAWTLIKKAAFELGEDKSPSVEDILAGVAEEIATVVKVTHPSEEPHIKVLFGGSGSGKTTAAAKIASLAAKQGKKVGLIGVGPNAAIEVYAKALGLPYRSARDSEEIRVAQEEFRPLDLVIIDMPSTQELPEVRSVEGRRIEHVMVIGANVNEKDNVRRVKLFRERVGLDSIVVTKVDETSQLGGLFSVIEAGSAPVSFYSNGQQVPESLKEASVKEIVSMILDL